jgi:hypothetical protein
MTGDKLAIEAIAAAESENDPEIGSRMRDALVAMSEFEGDRKQLRTKIADSLPKVNTALGAGALCMWLGAEVESGGNAANSIQSLITTLLKWIGNSTAIGSNRDEGITLVARSVVAHLLADDSLLRSYSANSELIESLDVAETDSPGPSWVLRVLRQRTGSLIVIHAEQRGRRSSSVRKCGNKFRAVPPNPGEPCRENARSTFACLVDGQLRCGLVALRAGRRQHRAFRRNRLGRRITGRNPAD